MEKMASRPEVTVLASIVFRPLRDHHRAEGRAEFTKSSFRGADLGSRCQKSYANEKYLKMEPASLGWESNLFLN